MEAKSPRMTPAENPDHEPPEFTVIVLLDFANKLGPTLIDTFQGLPKVIDNEVEYPTDKLLGRRARLQRQRYRVLFCGRRRRKSPLERKGVWGFAILLKVFQALLRLFHRRYVSSIDPP